MTMTGNYYMGFTALLHSDDARSILTEQGTEKGHWVTANKAIVPLELLTLLAPLTTEFRDVALDVAGATMHEHCDCSPAFASSIFQWISRELSPFIHALHQRF